MCISYTKIDTMVLYFLCACLNQFLTNLSCLFFICSYHCCVQQFFSKWVIIKMLKYKNCMRIDNSYRSSIQGNSILQVEEYLSIRSNCADCVAEQWAFPAVQVWLPHDLRAQRYKVNSNFRLLIGSLRYVARNGAHKKAPKSLETKE